MSRLRSPIRAWLPPTPGSGLPSSTASCKGNDEAARRTLPVVARFSATSRLIRKGVRFRRRLDLAHAVVKFARRNKAGVALASVILAALIASASPWERWPQRARFERLKAEREARFLVDMFKAGNSEVARGRDRHGPQPA